MHPKAPALVLTSILALAGTAAALLAGEAWAARRDEERTAEFQRLVGGLGFGPALDLSRCPNSFDPRLGDGCAEDLGPVPAGGAFCPQHAASVFYYPPLRSGGRTLGEGKRHALLP